VECEPNAKESSANEKLAAIREQMKKHGVDAYLIFSEDAHSSEYVGDCDQRRAFLTGMTGSAGVAVVTPTKALLWTDSRYFLQAEEQLSSAWTLMKQNEPNIPLLEEWIASHVPKGATVSCDPALVTAHQVQDWVDRCWIPRGILFAPVAPNLVDACWPSQPSRNNNPISIHPDNLAGETVPAKLARVREALLGLGVWQSTPPPSVNLYTS